MLANRSPHEAYRRVDFDARVEGANPQQLVGMCYEALAGALGTALTRALSAVTALQLGVEGDEGVALALRQLYQSARRSILDSALKFDPEVIGEMRRDFVEIARALTSAA